MVQISLSEQTAERLRAAARHSGATMAELLEQAIERFLATTWFSTKQPAQSAWSDQQTLIEQEQRVFEARHQELLTTYSGEYIAMRSGQVVDHDADRVALSRRIRAQYGFQPILITPVHARTVQTLQTRSPRLLDGTP